MATSKEADKKSAFIFCVAFSVIFLVIGLMVYADLFDTYLNDYFKNGLAREDLIRSGFGRFLLKLTHYLGIPCFLLAILWLWKMTDYPFGEKNGWVYFGVSLGLMLFGILLAAGFNFDLHGIEPGA